MYLYKRHSKKCRGGRSCRCKWWCDFYVEGERVHRSLKTGDKERAEDLCREIERGVRPVKEEPKPEPLTFQAASERFLNDLRAQNRAADTIRKYKLLFKQLAPNGNALADFTFDVLIDFRSTWTTSPAKPLRARFRLPTLSRMNTNGRGWNTRNGNLTNSMRTTSAASLSSSPTCRATAHSTRTTTSSPRKMPPPPNHRAWRITPSAIAAKPLRYHGLYAFARPVLNRKYPISSPIRSVGYRRTIGYFRLRPAIAAGRVPAYPIDNPV